MGSIGRKLELTTEQFSQLYKDILQSINGRHTMTAKELCEIDDLCTTLVVDPIVRFKSHKMNLDYEAPDMQTHLLCLSIMLQFIYDGDLMKVYHGLYSLKITQEFLKNRTDKAKMHLRDHLLRFIAMFRHDSGYTIVPCCRYGHENNVGAKLIATRYWKKDDVIDQLIGVIGNLTHEEEEELLIPGVNDFSVLISQRKKRPQLWLGPGAFLNHDCKPNCEFVANKNNTAVIVVLRDINPGDELFIYYGPSFFGENNELCECETCEKRQNGAFRKSNTTQIVHGRASPTPSVMSTYTVDAEGYARRKYALRARKQVNENEIYFDSRDFFQKIILDRFIGCPLIAGTENIKTNERLRLSSYKFNPQGLPVLDKTNAPVVDLLVNQRKGFDSNSLIATNNYAIESHFPKPLRNVREINVPNLLAFLGFNVCVVDDNGEKSKLCVMGSSRSWDKNVYSKSKRRPLKVKEGNNIKKKAATKKTLKPLLNNNVKESILNNNLKKYVKKVEFVLENKTRIIDGLTTPEHDETMKTSKNNDIESSEGENSNNSDNSSSSISSYKIACLSLNGDFEDELSEEEDNVYTSSGLSSIRF